MAKPVVASDIGGHREIIIDGKNGVLFAPEQTEDLAAKCNMLLEDASYRDELGTRSRAWVIENRDWKVLIERYISVYKKLSKSI